MTDVKVDSTSSAENNQTNNVKEKKEKSSGDQKPKSPKGGGGKDKFDEAALEKEFQAFVGKLKRQYGPNSLAYQISNHPEVSAIFLQLSNIKTS